MSDTTSLRAARQRLEQVRAQRPDDRQVVAKLLQVLEELDDHAALHALLAQAVDQWPEDSDLLMSRARIHTYLGDFADAKAAYQAILRRDPGHAGALSSMVMQGHGADVGGLATVEGRLASDDLADAERVALCYAQARLLEGDQRFGEAFETYRQANAARAVAGGMDIAAKQRGARAVLGDIDADIIERIGGRGHLSERPVFIVGMPRSGTTLTEQILAAHPQVYAAGERLFWGAVLGALVRSAPRREGSMVEAIDSVHERVWEDAGTAYLSRIDEVDAGSRRFTDKLPANFALLPFIRLVFPRARIVHVRRDPLATIASCITAPFSDPALAFSVEDWARFQGIYQALMDSWRPLLGDQLLELEYEELVSDLPAQARRLVRFIGLEWHDACLHPEQHRRAVRTASAQQVRRAVHSESVASWRRYASQLEALRPLIHESYAQVMGA
jgi:tetratricopeptide (TPR) repeat protein